MGGTKQWMGLGQGVSEPTRALSSAPGAESRPRRAILGVGIFVAYLIPGVVGLWDIWSNHPSSSSVQGGAGDTAIFQWSLHWTSWALAHGHNPLVTNVVNFPIGVNLASNTSIITLGLLSWPVAAVWGPVLALNVCWTLAFALSAGAGYLLARRFTTWRPAAFVAGLLYGYSPYMVNQGGGHLFLVFVPLPPLILLVLHELFVRQRGSAWRWGVVLAVLVILQFGVSTEVLTTTVMFSVLATIVVMLRWPAQVPGHLRHAAVGLGIAVVISVIGLALPLYEILAGPDHISGTVLGFAIYHAQLLGAVLPNAHMLLATAHLQDLANMIGGNAGENGSYLGIPLIVVLLIAPFVLRRRPALFVGSVMALVAFILSLGVSLELGDPGLDHVVPAIRLPGWLINKIPLVNAAFPGRYALYVALFASVALAVTLDAAHGGISGNRRAGPAHARASRPAQHTTRAARLEMRAAIVPILLAAVVLVPLVPRWPYSDEGPDDVPAYFTSSQVDALPPGQVALIYPFPIGRSSEAQTWQAVANYRFVMPGGYFVVPGPGGHNSAYHSVTVVEQVLALVFSGPAPVLTPGLRAGVRNELGSWDVRSVVVEEVGHDPLAFFTWLIGRPPDVRDGDVVAWYHTTW